MPQHQRTPPARATQGAIFGGLFGVLLLGVAAIRLIIILITGKPFDDGGYGVNQILTLVIVYCGSFAVAGAALAALWPLRKSGIGAYLLGYLGAGLVSVILVRLVMWLEHDHDLRTNLITACIMTIAFGTFAGYKIHHWDSI
jgi:hypothetical protein